MMRQAPKKTFFEVKPGVDAIRYLLSYSCVTLLARLMKGREQSFFVELSSSIDRHIVSEGLFEKGVIFALRDLIRQVGVKDLMIDIGANIGNHTVALARSFDRVESVEPHPVLFRVLEANVLRNNLNHVTCHNFGLASDSMDAVLSESVSNHGLSRVLSRSMLTPEILSLGEEEFGNQHSILLKSAREFVGQFSSLLSGAFIKIDVEGMEQEIIEAIEPLLKEHRPLVGFECFTKAQPNLIPFAMSIPGYEVHAIRLHDTGSNKLMRALRLIFVGRTYTIERVDPNALDDVYPLVLLVPIAKS